MQRRRSWTPGGEPGRGRRPRAAVRRALAPAGAAGRAAAPRPGRRRGGRAGRVRRDARPLALAARPRQGAGLPAPDGGEPVPLGAAAPRRGRAVRRPAVRATPIARPADAPSAGRATGVPPSSTRSARCPTRQREVLALRHYLELSEAEIADALGISRGSVKAHASRGSAALRELLADHLARGTCDGRPRPRCCTTPSTTSSPPTGWPRSAQRTRPGRAAHALVRRRRRRPRHRGRGHRRSRSPRSRSTDPRPGPEPTDPTAIDEPTPAHDARCAVYYLGRHAAGAAAVPGVPAGSVHRRSRPRLPASSSSRRPTIPTTGPCGRPARSGPRRSVADDVDRGDLVDESRCTTGPRHVAGRGGARGPAGRLHACRPPSSEPTAGAVRLGRQPHRPGARRADQRAAGRAPQLDVLALVSISNPAEGRVVEGSFSADGVASSFEGTVPWELRDADGHVVRQGFAQGDDGGPPHAVGDRADRRVGPARPGTTPSWR